MNEEAKSIIRKLNDITEILVEVKNQVKGGDFTAEEFNEIKDTYEFLQLAIETSKKFATPK